MTPNNSGTSGRIPEPQGCRATLRAEGDTTAGGARTSRDGSGEDGIPAGFSSLISVLNLPRQAEPEDRWQDEALCAQVDPELFFPEQGGSTKEAKRVCASCEVKAECLQYALDCDERFGVWGGLSERERRSLHRRPRVPRKPPVVTVTVPVSDRMLAARRANVKKAQQASMAARAKRKAS